MCVKLQSSRKLLVGHLNEAFTVFIFLTSNEEILPVVFPFLTLIIFSLLFSGETKRKTGIKIQLRTKVWWRVREPTAPTFRSQIRRKAEEEDEEKSFDEFRRKLVFLIAGRQSAPNELAGNLCSTWIFSRRQMEHMWCQTADKQAAFN